MGWAAPRVPPSAKLALRGSRNRSWNGLKGCPASPLCHVGGGRAGQGVPKGGCWRACALFTTAHLDSQWDHSSSPQTPLTSHEALTLALLLSIAVP